MSKMRPRSPGKTSRLFLNPRTTSRTSSFHFTTQQTCSEDVSNVLIWRRNSANKSAAPPQLSKAELKAAESEATLTIQKVIVGAVLLYLCMCSCFRTHLFREVWADSYSAAPFAIDAVTKLVWGGRDTMHIGAVRLCEVCVHYVGLDCILGSWHYKGITEGCYAGLRDELCTTSKMIPLLHTFFRGRKATPAVGLDRYICIILWVSRVINGR